MDLFKLFGTEVSLYTGKTRAYLRYKGIPFKEVLSTADVYKKIIIPRTGVRYIPILISPDNIAIQDTTEIIDFLEKRFPESPVYPKTPLQRLTALLLELYADEWLVLPAMYYRWWFKEDNYDFIVGEFGRSAMPDATKEEQQKTGEATAGFFCGTLPVLGITEKNHKQIEAWYESFLDSFNTHLCAHPFILGTRPSIGDFGLMGPLYAHLFRDPYPGKMMKQRAPLVARWVERMNAPIPNSGEFLSDDEIPETLYPILEMMFKEHFPVLLDTVKRLSEWIGKNPEKKIPRVIDKHEFSIGGVLEERMVFPYSQWMFQRSIDHYRSLSNEDKNKADALLKKLGGYEAMQVKIPKRVKRINNILVQA